MHVPPGRTPRQNDWPETTPKLTPSLYNPRPRAKWQSSSPGFPYPAALHLSAPSQWSLLLCQHVSPQIIHFWVLDKSPLLAPGRGPLSCNSWRAKIPHATRHSQKRKFHNQFQIRQMESLNDLWAICLKYKNAVPSKQFKNNLSRSVRIENL